MKWSKTCLWLRRRGVDLGETKSRILEKRSRAKSSYLTDGYSGLLRPQEQKPEQVSHLQLCLLDSRPKEGPKLLSPACSALLPSRSFPEITRWMCSVTVCSTWLIPFLHSLLCALSRSFFFFFFLVLPACLPSKGMLPRYIIETIREKQTIFGVLPNWTKSLEPLREKLIGTLSLDPEAKLVKQLIFQTGTLLNLECRCGKNEDPWGLYWSQSKRLFFLLLFEFRFWTTNETTIKNVSCKS